MFVTRPECVQSRACMDVTGLHLQLILWECFPCKLQQMVAASTWGQVEEWEEVWHVSLLMESRLPSVDVGGGVLTAVCPQNCLLWQQEQEEGNGVIWDYGWIPECSDIFCLRQKALQWDVVSLYKTAYKSTLSSWAFLSLMALLWMWMANPEQMLGSTTFREMGSVLGVSEGVLLQLWGGGSWDYLVWSQLCGAVQVLQRRCRVWWRSQPAPVLTGTRPHTVTCTLSPFVYFWANKIPICWGTFCNPQLSGQRLIICIPR